MLLLYQLLATLVTSNKMSVIPSASILYYRRYTRYQKLGVIITYVPSMLCDYFSEWFVP
jgi:hypothetical protein